MPMLGIMASQISGHLWAPSGAYDSIATVTLGSAASTITFSSIPSTYTHLQFRVMARDTTTGVTQTSLRWQFNGDTAANYTAYHDIFGNGASTGADGFGANSIAYLIQVVPGSDASNTTQYGVSILDILDYASTNKYKTLRGLGGHDRNGTGMLRFGSSMWMNSGTAISSITFTADGTQYAIGTTIALYGIKGQTMAAANTYVAIASQTLASTATSITFSSIPATYTDLVVVFQGGVASATANLMAWINNDTAANYSSTVLYGNGSTPTSGRASSVSKMYLSGLAVIDTTLAASAVVNFMNYANTTTNKSVLARTSNATQMTGASVSLWRSTAAINRIDLSPDAAVNFIIGSTFSLYGILAA